MRRFLEIHTRRFRMPRLLALVAILGYLPTSASAQVLNLAWDPTVTPDADYRVHVGTAAGTDNVLDQWVPGEQTTFAFTATPGVRYYFAVSSVGAEGDESAWSSAVVGGVPTFTQPGNQTGTVGTAISPLSLTVVDPDNGTLAFSATGLPAGLAINRSTGRITGTPTTVGSNSVTVTVEDGQTEIARSFTWTVSAGSGAVVSAVSATPSSGSGASQNFAFVYSNSIGASDLASARITLGPSATATANACAVSYNPTAGLLSLLNDAGTSWQSASMGSGQLQNSQCTVVLTSSSATVNDTRLTLNLAMRFGAAWTGAKGTYLYAASTSGPASGWVSRGSWTVPSPTLAVTSNVVSPKAVGTTVTFTGTVNGVSSGYQYKWWHFDGTTWTMVRDWGAATFAWTPSRAADHRVGFWARATGSTSDSGDLNIAVPYTITPGSSTASSSSSATSSTPTPSSATSPAAPALALTTNRPSPSVVGTAITFTGTANGSTSSHQFKWWHFDGTNWTMVRDWGGATFVWTPTTANLGHRVGYWARPVGSTSDAGTWNTAMSYPILQGATTGGPLVALGVTANVASPQRAGTTITLTASARGGQGPYQYKWWVFDGLTWSVAQNWGSGTLTWRPTAAHANYKVGFWVRDSGTTADTGAVNISIPYSVTP